MSSRLNSGRYPDRHQNLTDWWLGNFTFFTPPKIYRNPFITCGDTLRNVSLRRICYKMAQNPQKNPARRQNFVKIHLVNRYHHQNVIDYFSGHVTHGIEKVRTNPSVTFFLDIWHAHRHTERKRNPDRYGKKNIPVASNHCETTAVINGCGVCSGASVKCSRLRSQKESVLCSVSCRSHPWLSTAELGWVGVCSVEDWCIAALIRSPRTTVQCRTTVQLLPSSTLSTSSSSPSSWSTSSSASSSSRFRRKASRSTKTANSTKIRSVRVSLFTDVSLFVPRLCVWYYHVLFLLLKSFYFRRGSCFFSVCVVCLPMCKIFR